MMPRTVSPIAPKWTGICGALTTSSPAAVKTAQLKSSRSLTFTLRRRVPQRDAHLLGDAGEAVVEDFERDRIGFFHWVQCLHCGRGARLNDHTRCRWKAAPGLSPPRISIVQRLPAGIDHRGRGRLANDRRAGDVIARSQLFADETCRLRASAAEPCLNDMITLSDCSERGTRHLWPAPRRFPLRRADNFNPRRDDLQGTAFVDVAIELPVFGLRRPRHCPLAVRRWSSDGIEPR